MIINRALALLLLASSAKAAPFLPASTLRYEVPPQALLDDCRSAKKRAESALESVARMPAQARTFDNTPWALDRIASELSDETASASFLKYVSLSSSVRDAGNECETLLGQFAVEVYSREDLYRAIKTYAAKGDAPNGEAKRLLDKQLLDFKRSGLELPAARRQKVLELRKKIVELESAFIKNINEYKDFALFSKDELAGMPEDFVSRL